MSFLPGVLDDSGALVPFGNTFMKLGESLLNNAINEIFGDSGAARQTAVVIYNHTDTDLFFIDSSFETGGFTTQMTAPFSIVAKSAAAYKVESHGIGTGVTGAKIHYGLIAGDPTIALEIVTSNPFAGDNSANAQGFNGITVIQPRVSVGNANQVDVDIVNTP